MNEFENEPPVKRSSPPWMAIAVLGTIVVAVILIFKYSPNRNPGNDYPSTNSSLIVTNR